LISGFGPAIEVSGMPVFLAGGGKSGKLCGRYSGAVKISRLEDWGLAKEEENDRRARGHDLDVEAMASAWKKVADDVVGGRIAFRDIARASTV